MSRRSRACTDRKDAVGRIHATDRHPGNCTPVNYKVLAHHDSGKGRMLPPGITLRDAECTEALFGDMHRSTYDNRLKILYQ